MVSSRTITSATPRSLPGPRHPTALQLRIRTNASCRMPMTMPAPAIFAGHRGVDDESLATTTLGRPKSRHQLGSSAERRAGTYPPYDGAFYDVQVEIRP